MCFFAPCSMAEIRRAGVKAYAWLTRSRRASVMPSGGAGSSAEPRRDEGDDEIVLGEAADRLEQPACTFQPAFRPAPGARLLEDLYASQGPA